MSYINLKVCCSFLKLLGIQRAMCLDIPALWPPEVIGHRPSKQGLLKGTQKVYRDLGFRKLC